MQILLNFSFLDQYYQQFDTRVQPSIEQSEVSNIQIPDEVYGLQRAFTSSASSSQDTLSSPSVSQGSASSSSSSSSSSSPAVTTPYLNPINIPHFTQEISYPIAEERLESVLPRWNIFKKIVTKFYSGLNLAQKCNMIKLILIMPWATVNEVYILIF